MDKPNTIRRGYQAEVYLALATIIQGITLTILGDEVAALLRDRHFPDLVWGFITALLSLMLSFSFWYIFVRDFFFGFRVINLTAVNHFVLAAAIFAIGFLQFIAFQFITDPRLWLTLVLLSIAIVFVNSGYISRQIRMVEREDVRQAIFYDPKPHVFATLILIAVLALFAWYLIPGTDSPVFRGFVMVVMAAALIHLNLSSVKIFQKHLDVDL